MENARNTHTGMDALIAITISVLGALANNEELAIPNADVLDDLHGQWLAVAAAVGIQIGEAQ